MAHWLMVLDWIELFLIELFLRELLLSKRF